MQFTIGFIWALAALLTNVHATSGSGTGGAIVFPGTETATGTQAIPFPLLTETSSVVSSTTTVNSWVSPDVSSVTATRPSTYSSRPAASGFWTGTDPFSFIPPTYLTTTSTTRPTSPVTTVHGSASSNTTSHNTSTVKQSDHTTSMSTNTTAAQGPSTSISTHTNVVTATPTVTATSSSDINGSTTTSAQPTTSSSAGKVIWVSAELWVGAAFAMLGQALI